jgi:hypothetical protein
MSNCVFGFPTYSDPSPTRTVVVTSGFAAPGGPLPIENIQDRRLSRVARSANALTTVTIFDVDLGTACPVGVLAMLISNLTKSSVPTVRWVGGTTLAGNDVYDTGALQAWPTGVTLDDVLGADGSSMNVWTLNIPSTTKTARYWRCYIDDHANADGYVDVARVIIAGAYRPSRPLTVGARSQLENDTVRTKTEGGATLYKAMPTSRVDTFSLANIPESEALTSIRRMQHRLGTSGPLFFVLDETDPYRYMRSYQGTLRQLGALEYPDSLLYNTIGFEVAEDL